MAADYDRDSTGISKRCTELLKSNGITATSAGKIGAHSFRKTFVSLMDEAGAPTKVTDSVTGHARITMHDRYSQPDVDIAREWMMKALPVLTT